MKEWNPVWFVLPPFLVLVALVWVLFLQPFELTISLENSVPLPHPALVRIDLYLDNEKIGSLIPRTQLRHTCWSGMPRILTVQWFNENGFSARAGYDLPAEAGYRVVLSTGTFLEFDGQSLIAIRETTVLKSKRE
jgi:hypothetical protein